MPGACCGGISCLNALDADDCTFQSGALANYFEGFDCDFVNCELGVVVGACCVPDVGCVLTTRIFQDINNPSCVDRGGDFLGEGTTCAVDENGIGLCDPPPPLEGCITPRPDRAAGRGWSPNLCQNAVFLLDGPDPDAIVLPSDPPDAGDFGMTTPHPIRALPDRATDDPCAHHRGDLVIDDDGFASVAFCSQPVSGDPTSRQWSLAGLYVVDSDPNGFVAPGDAYFAGAYHAPFFTEAHLRSHKMRCEILR